MSVVNCGPNRKVFESFGSAVGLIHNSIDVCNKAYRKAYDSCLLKCKAWINSSTCKPACGEKSSWIEIRTVRFYAKSSGAKINVQVTIRMRATVKCRGLIRGIAKKKITGKKK